MFGKEDIIITVFGLVVSLVLVAVSLDVLLGVNESDTTITKVEYQTVYINVTEYVNWTISGSLEVISNDRLVFDCNSEKGPEIGFKLGTSTYFMKWGKFCDTIDPNIRWIVLLDN